MAAGTLLHRYAASSGQRRVSRRESNMKGELELSQVA